MGVILYIMLSHRMPFLSNDNDALTKHNILNKEINLQQRTWDGISHEAKDLVTLMLNRDKRDRINIRAVLEHQWFADIRSLK
jgi:serine/threonine protein kinase